jgi:hypothetical protein
MQSELGSEYPSLPITILAINEVGHEDGNDAIVAVGDLPVLQDDLTTNVWSAWTASWRDVVVVDADNAEVYRFNLRTYDLGNPDHYAHLKAVFVAVAQDSELPVGP